MKDERITLETAKILKEKNFNIWVYGSITEYVKTQKDPEYPEGGGPFGWEKGERDIQPTNYFCNNHGGCDYSNKKYKMYAAPTQSLVARWLREVHEIFVFVNYRSFGVKECNGWYYHIGKSPDHYSDDQFKTYEEAMEVGLGEGLKQIP